MRMSNNIYATNYLYYLNKNMQSQSDVQQQLSSGKKVQSPSDDPVVTAKSLMYNADLAENTKFADKASDATSFLETTDGALSSLEEVLVRAKELTIQAASANNSEGYNAIATELEGLIGTAVQIGNTAIGDRFIFAGTNDREQPFKYDGEGSTIQYTGNNGKISMRLQTGDNVDTQDAVNVTGSELFGSNNEVFTVLQDITSLLRSNGSVSNINGQLSQKLENLDDGLNSVLNQHAYIGTRMNGNDIKSNIIATDNVSITNVLSLNEDIDQEDTLIKYKMIDNTYQMALAVGAKILPKSLLDFLS